MYKTPEPVGRCCVRVVPPLWEYLGKSVNITGLVIEWGALNMAKAVLHLLFLLVTAGLGLDRVVSDFAQDP